MHASHVELSIVSYPAAFEDFIGILATEGFEGFWEDGATLRAYIPAPLWSETLKASVVDALRRCAALRGLGEPAVRTAVIAPKNWNEAWEATIQPVHVGSRFVITPSWHPYTPRSGEIVLIIDPKMSFGTGYHETTRLMVRLLERHVRKGETVLDVGCGTGILAIAGLKLGAKGAIGIDPDEWAYTNARENVGQNGVAAACTIRRGTLDAVPESGFGVIAANIQRNVIEPMLPALRSRMASGGRLLLSGLLMADRPAIVAALRSEHLVVIDEENEAEWIALAARRE